MDIQFFGAAGEVTGSKHLISTSQEKLLLDCGAFQGRRRESREKNRQLGFDAATVSAVIVSHAHFDHVGLLPLLVKQGFAGSIYATPATRDLAELILLDAAHLQEQDAMFANRHRLPDADLIEPIYTVKDIPAVMRRFVSVPYARDADDWTSLTPNSRLQFYDAGHILGSAVSLVELSDETGKKRIAYTGDLGRPDQPLLRDPQPVPLSIDALLMEATYGTRRHHQHSEVEQTLVDAVNQAIQTNGRIIVPAFSLGRTQALVYILHELTDAKKIPRIPIYVDSPLASRITQVFSAHQRDYDRESKTDFTRPNEDPLAFRNLTYTHSVEESKALNRTPGPWIVISASGMISGGRVMHHLRNHASDPTTQILFTGYQAEHTPGRRMIKGAKYIQIFGEPVPVKATLRILNDLSAHADADDLLAYAEHIPDLQRIFLTHSEPDRSSALGEFLVSRHPDWQITAPKLGDRYPIT